MDKSIQLEIAKLGDEVKKVVRRQEEMQKSLDLLFADRSILEEITGSVKHLQEIILQNQTYQDNRQKDIKAEIREANAITENTVHNIENKIDSQTIVVKSKTAGILETIKNTIQKGVI